MVVYASNPSWRLEAEEDGVFEASLHCTVRRCLRERGESGGGYDEHDTYLCGHLPQTYSLCLLPLGRINAKVMP